MAVDQKPRLDKPHFPPVQNIEVGYDSDFLQRWMRFEKVAWVVMTVALAAGLAGVFGRGPLAKATVKAGDGTEVNGKVRRDVLHGLRMIDEDLMAAARQKGARSLDK